MQMKRKMGAVWVIQPHLVCDQPMWLDAPASSQSEDLNQTEIYNLMMIAYSKPLSKLDAMNGQCMWHSTLEKNVQLGGKLYVSPGRRSVGHIYVHILTVEIHQLATGNHSAERVLGFSATMLLRDKMVKGGVTSEDFWNIG